MKDSWGEPKIMDAEVMIGDESFVRLSRVTRMETQSLY